MNNKYYLLGALALAGGAYFIAPSGGSSGAEASSSVPGKPSPTTFNASESAKSSPSSGSRSKKAENILLSKSNTIVFRAVVSPLSVADAQQKLLDMNRSLSKGQPIYLVLDTPGGDIASGNQLIDTALGLGRPVHTISTFAASMGFNIAQRLSKRYVTPSGTLMAHRATVSNVGGQIPGEFLTAVGLIYRTITKMEMQNAARLGISFQDYTALVKDEYWVSGEDAVDQNAADAVANIQCDETLQGTNSKSFDTLFGKATVKFSNCPAISMPVSVEFGDERVNPREAARYLNDANLLRKALRGADKI
jgi:ATP-dependent protease ClpP protease subunit